MGIYGDSCFKDLLLEDWGFLQGEAEGEQSIDIQKTGPLSSIDKKRTLLENIKRNALSGPPKMGGFAPEDLRFRVIGKEKEETNTAIIAVLDVSGSMGTRERYLAHTFYHWLLRVLRKKPGNRDIVFIHHDSGAGLVDEKQFFTLKGGGGTKVSAAYQKILELIGGKFARAKYDIHGVHITDGNNLSIDNYLCLTLLKGLLTHMKFFMYLELEGREAGAPTLMDVFSTIRSQRFKAHRISNEGEIYSALRCFLTGGGE
ncbi:MAG: DUF444 family protein [Clostridia bacterium]|nr:DUF444 family protein [Clostridia bacterium]